MAALRDLRAADGTIIDRGLVLWFQGPSSFTGEDVAELHLHGGPAIIDAMTGRLAGLEGLSPAEPGEFSRQAFANGRLDLTEAEGLADLIAAETEQQRRLALRQVQGGLKDLYEGWRALLVKAGAHLEACIDFADEDIPGDLLPGVRTRVGEMAASMRAHLADHRRGEIIRDGFNVVIIGAPNVGKSSLLNALASREVAIVSSVPGTTRDPIEVRLDLGGYAVTLIDTAGLRDTTDEVESEGIRRTRQRAQAADLRLAVVEDFGDGIDSRVSRELGAQDAVLVNKVDLSPGTRGFISAGEHSVFAVSARTGEGISDLLAWLERQVILHAGSSESMPMTRARHRAAIETALHWLERFGAAAGAMEPALDLLAEDLRLAARELGRITGRIDVEDYLDVIFRDFCIGK
jgi:tRNA modification GTPase